MKKSKAGFLLVESLIVSTFISVTLMFVYTQFKVVYESYDRSFTYNTVSNLYKMSTIKDFFKLSLDQTANTYVDSNTVLELSTCPNTYIANSDYCTSLFISLKITKLYLVSENLTAFKTLIDQSSLYGQDLVDFTKYIKYGTVGYRIIAEFSDGTFASVNLM